MLTYRTGAAGASSAARFMSEHLLQQTLPPEMAAMAEYYEQGVTPPTPADALASRYGHPAVAGHLSLRDGLDELIKIEVLRLAESALATDGAAIAEDELILRALGAFEGAGLIGREELLASLARFGVAGLAHRLDAAVSDAGQDRDYSCTGQTPWDRCPAGAHPEPGSILTQWPACRRRRNQRPDKARHDVIGWEHLSARSPAQTDPYSDGTCFGRRYSGGARLTG
jgi:hypothetical protein